MVNRRFLDAPDDNPFHVRKHTPADLDEMLEEFVRPADIPDLTTDLDAARAATGADIVKYCARALKIMQRNLGMDIVLFRKPRGAGGPD